LYYSTHLVAGAAAGIMAESPAEGFVLGVLTHVILDLIPHHDHESVTTCILDCVLGTAVFLAVIAVFHPEMKIIWGALGGVLPDIEIAMYHFRLIRKRVFPSHTGCIPHLSTTRMRGLIMQSLVIVLGLWILS